MTAPPRIGRARLGLRAELLLAALPTITVLIVFAIVETFTRQRLLFASLAGSAFLIYLDPEHATNQIKTLLVAQLGAATIGYLLLLALGPGYAAAAIAMVITIGALVALDRVHPPAVSTALAFAFQDTKQSNLWLFGLAAAMVALLCGIERGSLWFLEGARSRQKGA